MQHAWPYLVNVILGALCSSVCNRRYEQADLHAHNQRDVVRCHVPPDSCRAEMYVTSCCESSLQFYFITLQENSLVQRARHCLKKSGQLNVPDTIPQTNRNPQIRIPAMSIYF